MAWEGSVTAVTVASDTLTTIETVKVREGASRLWASIELTADNNLSDFHVDIRPHSSAAWKTIASAASDFDSCIQEPIIACGDNPVNLAKSGVCLIGVDVRALDAVRFQAFADAGSDAVASCYWQVR